jgi:hypothetical protein
MKCERCGSDMREEQVCVTGGLVKIKNVSAWHCTGCGRVEYQSTLAEAPATPNRRPLDLRSSV